MKLLLAEDERELSNAIVRVLKHNNYTVDAVYDGAEALEYLTFGNYDGVILDIMMPKADGLTVLRKAREGGNNVPVLLLTARSEVDDRVEGLDAGADDYLTKPFGVMELLARVRALLRRTQEETPSAVMTLGDVTLDRESHRVTAGGQEVALTHMEFELLAFLMAHAGKAVTREVLLDDVWGIAYSGDTRTIDVHVRTLRQKLGDSGRLITTIRNVGYRMDEHPEAGES